MPFPQKDEAKRLGARWDGAARRWYVPTGTDSAPFERWIPRAVEADPGPRCKVRVLVFGQGCWKCGAVTKPIVGIIVSAADLPGPSETDGLVSFSDVAEALAVSISPGALRHIGTGPLRRRYSATQGREYISNGCVTCNALIGDIPTRLWFDEYCEAGLPLDDLIVGRVSIPVAALPPQWAEVIDDPDRPLPAYLTGQGERSGIEAREITLAEGLEIAAEAQAQDGYRGARPYQ